MNQQDCFIYALRHTSTRTYCRHNLGSVRCRQEYGSVLPLKRLTCDCDPKRHSSFYGVLITTGGQQNPALASQFLSRTLNLRLNSVRRLNTKELKYSVESGPTSFSVWNTAGIVLSSSTGSGGELQQRPPHTKTLPQLFGLHIDVNNWWHISPSGAPWPHCYHQSCQHTTSRNPRAQELKGASHCLPAWLWCDALTGRQCLFKRTVSNEIRQTWSSQTYTGHWINTCYWQRPSEMSACSTVNWFRLCCAADELWSVHFIRDDYRKKLLKESSFPFAQHSIS